MIAAALVSPMPGNDMRADNDPAVQVHGLVGGCSGGGRRIIPGCLFAWLFRCRLRHEGPDVVDSRRTKTVDFKQIVGRGDWPVYFPKRNNCRGPFFADAGQRHKSRQRSGVQVHGFARGCAGIGRRILFDCPGSAYRVLVCKRDV